MPSLTTWLAFVGLATAMVLSPGPNMTYLVSRSICQGPRAGLVSLIGVAAGFVVWMTGNGIFALGAGRVAVFLIRRPRWGADPVLDHGQRTRRARVADGDRGSPMIELEHTA